MTVRQDSFARIWVGTVSRTATQGFRGRMEGLNPDTVWIIIPVATVAVALSGFLQVAESPWHSNSRPARCAPLQPR